MYSQDTSGALKDCCPNDINVIPSVQRYWDLGELHLASHNMDKWGEKKPSGSLSKFE